MPTGLAPVHPYPAVPLSLHTRPLCLVHAQCRLSGNGLSCPCLEIQLPAGWPGVAPPTHLAPVQGQQRYRKISKCGVKPSERAVLRQYQNTVLLTLPHSYKGLPLYFFLHTTQCGFYTQKALTTCLSDTLVDAAFWYITFRVRFSTQVRSNELYKMLSIQWAK